MTSNFKRKTSRERSHKEFWILLIVEKNKILMVDIYNNRGINIDIVGFFLIISYRQKQFHNKVFLIVIHINIQKTDQQTRITNLCIINNMMNVIFNIIYLQVCSIIFSFLYIFITL